MNIPHDPGSGARGLLLDWIRDLIGREDGCWDASQRTFLDSLLRGQEGTKTLAELAVTSARIRASGLQPEDLGPLREMHDAIEMFWNNPCPESYENLRTVGQSLDPKSE
ncbi:MAG TPA: hypothetical protein VFW45_12505 [Candidatus Polarisedimenticolia bacterium]|nr:hypothetical protein [Candidatus Polarisedimenticolia bacterium]